MKYSSFSQTKVVLVFLYTCACFASPPNWFGARNKGRVILSLDVNSVGNAEVYREFIDLSMKITEHYVY
jgi:hypothetical protein